VRDWLYQYHCGAGRGAREKYREVHGHWQKRVFRRPWLIYAALALPIAILGWTEHANFWLWTLGMVLSLVLGAFIAIVASPPAYIENWQTGSEGERRTARALAPLRRCGCYLLHDLPDRRTSEQNRKGNLDHVVVSPAGVFLLDTKWLGGEASIDHGTVHIQRRDDEEDAYDIPRLARAMRGRAVRLQGDIAQQTSIRFVQPVVVFWNTFEAGLVMSESVVFVHGDRLVDWLQEQRPRMTANEVAHIASCISEIRPCEHRAWWKRRLTFGLLGQGTPATTR
jgi:hypothetical protein